MGVANCHLCLRALLDILLWSFLHYRDRPQGPGGDYPKEHNCCTPSFAKNAHLLITIWYHLLDAGIGNEMQLPNVLSRLSSVKQRYEIPLELHVDYIAFSDCRLAQLHKETKSCPVLSTVYRLMHNWWPATCRQTPRIGHKYWNMCNKVTSDDSLFLKGSRISIPPALESHFCITSMKNIQASPSASSQSESSSTGLTLTSKTTSGGVPPTSGYHLHFQKPRNLLNGQKNLIVICSISASFPWSDSTCCLQSRLPSASSGIWELLHQPSSFLPSFHSTTLLNQV